MGVLDRLMFWKKDTVELDYHVEQDVEYEVDGCFTLPMDGTEVPAVPGVETIVDGDTATDDPATEQC